MEFIIRRIEGNIFDLPYESFESTLHLNSVPYKTIKGWGDHRIEVMGCEIAFSHEFVGFQVIFGNCNITEEEAKNLLEEILQNIQKETGQKGEIIQTD